MIDNIKSKILIAEDEMIVAMDIKIRLENAGYQVVGTVISGEDAVHKALETQPDLVLMDIGLQGDMDGIAAAYEIHRKLDTPIVYLTSYSNQTTLQRAKLSVAYGYLLKPFEERTLLSTLEVALYKHKLDREVKQREEHFRRLIENVSDMILVLDEHSFVTYASPTTLNVMDYPREEFIGIKFCDVCHPDELPRLRKIRDDTKQTTNPTPTIEHRLRKHDGSWIIVRTTGKYVEDKNGGYLILTSHDITETKAATEALRLSEERFRGIVERNFDAIISIDLEGNITYASPAAKRITGYQIKELIGKPFLSFLSVPNLSRIMSIFSKILHREAVEEIELRLLREDGVEIHIEANTTPIVKDEQVIGIQVIFRDISERKKAEIDLHYMATHDYLTNLPNTRLFLDHLDKSLARAKRNSLQVALLYLDLDGFKTVNDTFGHSIGDNVLQLAAKRLEEGIRKADIVSRLGGDEFAVLMTDLPNLNNVDTLAARLNQAMQAPFVIQNTTAKITVSIGISIFPNDTQNPQELIKLADQAMFWSKTLGKNRYSYFSSVKLA